MIFTTAEPEMHTGGASGDRFTYLGRFADAKNRAGQRALNSRRVFDEALHRHAGLGLGTGHASARLTR